MVATKRQHFGIAVVDDVAGVLNNRIFDGPRIVGIKKTIAIINHRQVVKRVKTPREKQQFGQLHTGGTHGRRAQTRT